MHPLVLNVTGKVNLIYAQHMVDSLKIFRGKKKNKRKQNPLKVSTQWPNQEEGQHVNCFVTCFTQFICLLNSVNTSRVHCVQGYTI